MTDGALPEWVLWALLATFVFVALCALWAELRRKRDEDAWQQVLGTRMQEAANEDE
jgi:hypothetical protein